MPNRKVQFANNEVYHIIVRALDNNIIFKDINDYYRGIFSIYEFNNTKPVAIFKRRREIKAAKNKTKSGRGPASSGSDERDKLVEVLAFCFMPNHIHLLIKQIKDRGIIKFLSKVETGFAGYFNRKYSRQGYVFQNRFKAVQIKTDEQLKIVFAYIHANSVSLIEPKWKELGIKNFDKCLKFIENYKWSSCQDYIGKANFQSVTDRQFISNTIGGEMSCKNFIGNYLKYKGGVKEFDPLLLE